MACSIHTDRHKVQRPTPETAAQTSLMRPHVSRRHDRQPTHGLLQAKTALNRWEEGDSPVESLGTPNSVSGWQDCPGEERLSAQQHRSQSDPAEPSQSSETGFLTPDQEIRLARRIEKGDRAAKDKLVNANLRLVASIAQRYQGRGVLLEDLIQEGTLGLLHAAEKFNWRKGFRFSTYAVYWIRQAIMRAIANSGRSIRLPAYMMDTLGRLARIRGELENNLGRQPTQAELAAAAGLSEERVSELLQSMVEPVSLQMPLGEEGTRSLAELIPDEESQNPSARVHRHVLQEEVARALAMLQPREAEVLRLRYGLNDQEPLTLEEIGKALHITRERARQLQIQALEKLRKNRAGKRLRETVISE